MQYSKLNFHKHTFCEFQEVTLAEIKNVPLRYKSKSGSSYFFTEKGVFRKSNHWGRAANCRWRLITNSEVKTNNSSEKIGYANWYDFYPNNENERLFYIEMNWETNEVQFQHKNNPMYKDNYVLRNASATAKRIQTIKEVLKDKQWAKYIAYEDYDSLQKEIINQLIQTEDSFIKIKQLYS